MPHGAACRCSFPSPLKPHPHCCCNFPQALSGRVAALTEVCEAMAGQLAECYAATAAQLPMRLSELESRVQATAQTTADVVKVGGRGMWSTQTPAGLDRLAGRISRSRVAPL